MMSNVGDVRIGVGPPTLEAFSDFGSALKNNVNRVGKYGRKSKEDGALPSNEVKKQPAVPADASSINVSSMQRRQ